MHNPLSLWSGGFQLKTSRIRTEWRRTKRQLSWTYGSDQLGWGHDQYYHESNAITSPFKVTVWAAHQFFQLILLSVWPRGPHFTMHSHTVFLPLMHRLFRQLGDNQSWNRKGRKAIRDALALLALRSQKSRTQRTLKHKKKKKCDHDMPRKHWPWHSDCAWYPKDAQCPTVPICISSLLQFT